MNQLRYTLAVLFGLLLVPACGAPEDVLEGDELGTLEQPVDKLIHYGVKSSGSTKGYTCSPGWPGLCYYGAPGEDGVARVYLDTAGMTSSEAAEFSASLDLVIEELNEGQQNFNGATWVQRNLAYDFVRWTGSAASARVIVKKGVVGCNDGLCMQNVAAYVDFACLAQNPLLVESPNPLDGTHRVCTRMQVTIDGADLNDVVSPTSRELIRNFAIANGLLASQGVGRVSGGTWDGDNISDVLSNPLILTFPLSSAGICRAHFYDYTGSTITQFAGCIGE